MGHPFKHLRLICKHRHRVIANAFHCGIFFHSLKHDLSKFHPKEFFTSARYYSGTYSPVAAERKDNDFFSTICQHHTKRNPHHWEYWCDWFKGNIVMKTMPWKYATEYVCDMLSASYCYDPKGFKPETTLAYFRARSSYYLMTAATRAYVDWCLERYATLGFAGLKKKDTQAKYKEITASLPQYEQKLVPGAAPLEF